MAAYLVVLAHDVRDPERLGRYADAVAPVVARHGGTYRAVDFDPAALEGERPAGVVLAASRTPRPCAASTSRTTTPRSRRSGRSPGRLPSCGSPGCNSPPSRRLAVGPAW